MDKRKLASFQRQIETVFKLSLADLDLRIKKLFPVLRIKSLLDCGRHQEMGWISSDPAHVGPYQSGFPACKQRSRPHEEVCRYFL